MKIYTKLGDKGETSLIGGKRVVKHHFRIEAYGTIDELIACIAVLKESGIENKHRSFLLKTQHILMNCAALLASDNEKNSMQLPQVNDIHIDELEREIDKIDKTIPTLKSFIIPGGDIASAHCHVARNVCRRAERVISAMNENYIVDDMLKKYINRLSDYLFVLSRRILYDKGIDEIEWKY